MLGLLNSLARAPWWLLAAMAVAVAYFGNIHPDFSFGQPPDLLGMLERAAPDIAPAIAWLESMGFQSQQQSFGIQKETWIESRAPVLAMALGAAAVLRFFLATPKERTQKDSDEFLNSSKTINAILKDAPGAISDDAWNDPLRAHADPGPAARSQARGDAPPLRLRAKPARKKALVDPVAAPQHPQKPKLRSGKPSFLRGVSAKKSAERSAVESAFRSKMEADPFEKLARQARG
ncbi:MAG: hypothetical protein AAF841_13215 [Pseudomonadota bacterium]